MAAPMKPDQTECLPNGMTPTRDDTLSGHLLLKRRQCVGSTNYEPVSIH